MYHVANLLLCHILVIMNDGDQYFEKKIIFMAKNHHSPTSQNLIDGGQSMISTWHHGWNYN